MKRLILKPTDFEMPLSECPPGLFLCDGNIGFKTEYRTDGRMEVFCESGEVFWGGTNVEDERRKIKVIPLESQWVEE